MACLDGTGMIGPLLLSVSPTAAQQGQALQVSKLLPGLHGLRLTPDPPLCARNQARQGLLLQHVWKGLHFGECGGRKSHLLPLGGGRRQPVPCSKRAEMSSGEHRMYLPYVLSLVE